MSNESGAWAWVDEEFETLDHGDPRRDRRAKELLKRFAAKPTVSIPGAGDGGAGRKLWQDLPHFTALNYAIPISLAFVRTDAFEALPESVQRQVMQVAAETEQSQFQLLANRTAENYARMRANGVEIAEPAPAPVLAALKQGASAPIAMWKAKAPPEAVAIVEQALQQQ